jgi:cellulose synthase/poly-beta-1,6-N-acetylglucosamine synthase-like glycosyltransferase
MAGLLPMLSVALAGLIAIPVLLFCLETIAAVAFAPSESEVPQASDARWRIAVLVPAHNESAGLLKTLQDIQSQLLAGDRLLVVADNCTDDTAANAKAAGAEVIERHNPEQFGKGYALDFGLRHLSADPPQIVIVVDADCRLSPDAIERLAAVCMLTGRPAQALNLMSAPEESEIDYRVALFAYRVKNWIRPLGLRVLGLPCQLSGTGMAFPWTVIGSVNLATALEVEDLKLGLDLAQAGHPPLFVQLAKVTSEFPSTIRGAKSQRRRWERGHIRMIGSVIPRLVGRNLLRGDLRLLALSLDAAVPPLTFLGILVVFATLVSSLLALAGVSHAAFAVSAASMAALAIAVLLSWWKVGRDVLPPRAILSVLPYVARKIPLYRQILSRGDDAQWIRTDRAGLGPSSEQR